MASQTTKARDAREDTPAQDAGASEARVAETAAIIRRNMIWALGVGSVPFPVVDLLGITGVQVKMLKELSELYGIKFSEGAASKVIASLITGFGSVNLGMGVVGSAVKLVPGVGGLLGVAAVPVTASALTYATGRVFVMHFESGGTLLDFKPEAMREHFRKEFEQGRLVAKSL